MKKYNTFCLFFLYFLLTFCHSEDPKPLETPQLETSESELIFMYEGGEKIIEVHSNLEWSPKSDSEWCIVNKRDKTIAVTVGENLNNILREAKITLSGDNLTKEIKIIQKNYIHQLTLEDNAPKAGDHLVKKLVEFIDMGESGENVTWNFTNIKITNEEYAISYDSPYLIPEKNMYIMGKDTFYANETDIKNLIICTENYTMYYYQIKGNKMYATGYENAVNLAQYYPRMIENVYPVNYSDAYYETYASSGLYSSSSAFASEGEVRIDADAYGKIILPSGKTVNHVIRIKSKRKAIEKSNYGPNSSSIYYNYKWYAKGYRYPLLESRQIIYESIGIISEYSIYYPPEDHTYLNNSINLPQLPFQGAGR